MEERKCFHSSLSVWSKALTLNYRGCFLFLNLLIGSAWSALPFRYSWILGKRRGSFSYTLNDYFCNCWYAEGIAKGQLRLTRATLTELLWKNYLLTWISLCILRVGTSVFRVETSISRVGTSKLRVERRFWGLGRWFLGVERWFAGLCS